jgi:hypothetical protein
MQRTTTDSVADIDVSGDGSYEGLTFAFQEDEPEDLLPFLSSETDQDRRAYIEDVFEGSSDTVTSWKSLPNVCDRIDINGAENRMLESMKAVVQRNLTTSSRLAEKQLDVMLPADFANIYLNRDWYLLMLDYVNGRIEEAVSKIPASRPLHKKFWRFNASGFFSVFIQPLQKISLPINQNGLNPFVASRSNTIGTPSYFGHLVQIYQKLVQMLDCMTTRMMTPLNLFGDPSTSTTTSSPSWRLMLVT